MSIEHLLVSGSGATTPAPGTAPSRNASAAADVAREFEALFLLQMLKQMRQSMLDDPEHDAEGLGGSALFDTIDSALARALTGRTGVAALFAGPLAGMAGEPSAPAVPPDASTVLTLAPLSAAPSLMEGPVTSGFGWRSDPFEGTRRFHAGIDIAAAYGREVPAAAAGKVVFAGEQGGYGNCVTVEHPDGLRTRYAHLSAVAVRVGDQVGEGQAVGRVGQSGRATGPHLHFEILRDGRAVDPHTVPLKLASPAVDYPSGSSPAPGDRNRSEP